VKTVAYAYSISLSLKIVIWGFCNLCECFSNVGDADTSVKVYRKKVHILFIGWDVLYGCCFIY
jgi:hypothetical protein